MFEQVVFAGGGNRCWWQAGFWDTVAPEILLRPRLIVGVSAGAATACMLYANDSVAVLGYYAERLRLVRSNVQWSALWHRGERVFPHARLYRQALTDVLGGEYFSRLRERAPEIRVQFARLPRGLTPILATGVGLIAYNTEKYLRRSLHPRLGRRIGFTPEVVRVNDCPSDESLVSLLIASSCTPPFTPIEYVDGRPTLDGGMVDNVPVGAADPGRSTLVLLTRRYPRYRSVFAFEGRLYVQPSTKVPASSWDYTNPAAMMQTYQQGRRDGAMFLHELERQRNWVESIERGEKVDDSRDLEA